MRWSSQSHNTRGLILSKQFFDTINESFCLWIKFHDGLAGMGDEVFIIPSTTLAECHRIESSQFDRDLARQNEFLSKHLADSVVRFCFNTVSYKKCSRGIITRIVKSVDRSIEIPVITMIKDFLQSVYSIFNAIVTTSFLCSSVIGLPHPALHFHKMVLLPCPIPV